MTSSTVQSFAGEATAVPLPVAPARALARVPELDGIRGIAILLVLALHFGWPESPPGALKEILGMGWAGVDLFFVLSGFLITGILLDSKGQPDYFRRFYLRRVFRIFPIYYAFLIVFFHVAPVIAHATGRLASFGYGRGDQVWFWVYLSNWRDAAHQNRHLYLFWSLSIEEQFYIVWPLVIHLIPTRTLKYVCLGLAIFSPVLRFVAGRAGVSPDFLFRGTLFRLDGLALGALLALAARDAILHKRVAKLVRWAWLVAAAVIVCLVIRSGPQARSPEMTAYGYTCVAVLSCSLVFWGVVHSGTKRRLAQFLRTPWLVRFGKYSYGAYVWHALFGDTLHRGLEAARQEFGLSTWSLVPASLIVGIAMSYGVALLSWKVIEEPCARLKERVAA